MKALKQLTYVNLLLFYREFPSLFFALIFPVMLLLLFGFMFGGESTIEEGFTYVEEAVPGFIVVVIATVGLLQVSVNTSLRKEMKLIRSFKVTPLTPFIYVCSDTIANFIVVFCSMIILSFVGWLIFGMGFAGHVMLTLIGTLVCCAVFFSIGYLITIVSNSSKTTAVIGNSLFFTSMFLSGAAIPLAEMPEYIQTFTSFLPMTQAVTLMQGLWFGYQFDVLILLAAPLLIYAAVILTISVRYFKWE